MKLDLGSYHLWADEDQARVLTSRIAVKRACDYGWRPAAKVAKGAKVAKPGEMETLATFVAYRSEWRRHVAGDRGVTQLNCPNCFVGLAMAQHGPLDPRDEGRAPGPQRRAWAKNGHPRD